MKVIFAQDDDRGALIKKVIEWLRREPKATLAAAKHMYNLTPQEIKEIEAGGHYK